MDIRTAKLEPDTVFHIFNRGINSSKVFFEEDNYRYILDRYVTYVHPYVETFAYCLLGNHYHLLIRVRPASDLDKVIKKNKDQPYCWHVSNAFSSWLQSYTRAINKRFNRTGSLFETPFKRIEVHEARYFMTLVAYIHQNPEKHGLINDFRNYPHSSFHGHLLSHKISKLRRKEVLDWFGGERAYQAFHDKYSIATSEEWMLE